jgi:hypothetical protein
MWKYNQTQMKLAIVVLTICLIMAAILVLWKDSSHTPTKPTNPILHLTAENNSNRSIVYINNCYDPDEVLEFDDVYIYLLNGSFSKRIEEHFVADILNNKNSNVTFYDNDHNGILSVGDEFQIESSITWPGMKFMVIFKPYGVNIGKYQFAP